MDASIKRMAGFPSGILSAMIVTLSLFVTLPLLTKFQKPPSTQTNGQSVLIDLQKPSPPPSKERDETRKQILPEKEFTERQKNRPLREQTKFDIPRGNLITGINDGIEIGITSTFHDTVAMSDPAYRPEEVDQSPRSLRQFPPQYPYIAKRDNIEGWVVLRFVVDTEGVPGKVEVLSADPVGIFEEAAMKAVARYRFEPALKNGEAVNCIMKQRIIFTLH